MKWVKVGLEYALFISCLWVLALMYVPRWFGSLRRNLTFRKTA